MQCCGSRMFILDQNFSIPDSGSGSKRFRIPDPYPHQRIEVFLTKKIVFKLSEIRFGIPILIFYPSRISDLRVKKGIGIWIRNTAALCRKVPRVPYALLSHREATPQIGLYRFKDNPKDGKTARINKKVRRISLKGQTQLMSGSS